MSKKQSKSIPCFTTGNIGVPSTKFTPNENTVFISAYTGKILDGRPTFTTKTDDPTGKNPTYHGCVQIPNTNIGACHNPWYS